MAENEFSIVLGIFFFLILYGIVIYNMVCIYSCVVLCCVVGVIADYLKRDLGSWVKCPPWGSFQEILARIYASFGENRGKLRTARSTSATEE